MTQRTSSHHWCYLATHAAAAMTQCGSQNSLEPALPQHCYPSLQTFSASVKEIITSHRKRPTVHSGAVFENHCIRVSAVTLPAAVLERISPNVQHEIKSPAANLCTSYHSVPEMQHNAPTPIANGSPLASAAACHEVRGGKQSAHISMLGTADSHSFIG